MKNSITWVGLDVHKRSINVARISCDGRLDEWQIENDAKTVKRLARKLVRDAEGREVRCCYEAGPCGYAPKRQMEEAAPDLVCEVIAPSLVPSRAGDRVKTDRRDARRLAEMLRAGLLTEVHAPTEEEESIRDLCRCRDDLRRELMAARHRLSKWLLKRGIVWHRKNWTLVHERWLRSLTFERPAEQIVFAAYLEGVEQVAERKKRIELKMEEFAASSRYAQPVGWLRCFRGIDTITALTVMAEVHDFRRFHTAHQLMSYLGLVPSEHSSGARQHRGAITKAGNSHVRRLLVEAAWHHRHTHRVGSELRKRREGQPQWAVDLADRAGRRLSKRYARFIERKMPHPKAVTATARELAGFIWALVQHWQPQTAVEQLQ